MELIGLGEMGIIETFGKISNIEVIFVLADVRIRVRPSLRMDSRSASFPTELNELVCFSRNRVCHLSRVWDK